MTNGATSLGSPSSLSEPQFAVKFDDSINSFLIGGNDFLIEPVSPDGSTTALAPNQGMLAEAVDPTDSSGHTVLVSVVTPLPRGTYRLVLLGNSSLVGTDGRPASSTRQDLNLFQVGSAASDPAPTSPAGTTDSPTSVTVAVGASPADAPRTQITLAPNLSWTLSANCHGLDLDSLRFNLFNSAQQLVSSGTGAELPDLSRRMPPGTYELQVDRSISALNPAPGSVEITVATTPVAAAIPGVQSVQLVNFNRTSLNPDSIEIQFAGRDLPPALLDPSASSFTVTNSRGQTWKLTATAYDPGTNTLALLFPSYLPTDHYSLLVSSAGSTSTAPASTLLGSFATEFHPLAGDDLGTAFPMGDGAVEYKNPTRLAPEQTTTQYVSIERAGRYQINLSNPSISSVVVRLDRTGAAPGGSATAVPVDPAGILATGEYEIIARNHTATSQVVAFNVVPSLASSESLALGGVGQMPARGGSVGLIGAASPTTAASLVATTPPLAVVAPDAAHPVIEPAASIPIPVGSTGSFRLQAWDQAPIGSSSAPSVEAGHAAPTSPPVAVALNSTMLLNSWGGLGALAQSRPEASLQGLAGSPELGSEPISDSVPSEQAVAIRLEGFDPPPPVIEPALARLQPERATLARERGWLAPTVLAADAPSPSRSEVADPLGLDQLPKATELASLARPLGVVVAGCLVYRWVKRTREAQRVASHPGRFQARHWSMRTRSFAPALNQPPLV